MGRFRYKERSLHIRRSLDTARASQQAGRLEETERLTRRVLDAQPDHPEALFLLASALHGRGKEQEAAEQLARAVALSPLVAAFHGQLGNVLAALGKHQEAAASFERALSLDPHDPNTYNGLGSALYSCGRSADAIQQFRKGLALPGSHPGLLMNLAILLHDQGETEEAIFCYRRLLTLEPQAADALQNLAHILKQRGELGEALDLYDRLLDVRPELTLAHLNLGIALQNEEKLDEACRCYRKVISLSPEMAPAHNNLGSALRLQGNYAEAITSLERAIELDPNLVIAHNNLGLALQGQKKWGKARAVFERILAIAPEDPDAYNNLGNLATTEEKFQEALEWFGKAQGLSPNCAEVWNNLANALREIGRLDKAAENYRRAIELKPDFPDAYSNMGNALRELGQFPEALAAYERAIELRPENPGFRWNKSLAALSCGRLQDGWEGYEWGFACKQRQPLRPFNHPRWQGQSLTGKTILTWGEQGVGDEILFANCIPELSNAADHCIVECDTRLVPLFARSFPDCEVIARTNPPGPRTRWPDIDLHSPMGTLPQWLRPTFDRFPRHTGFLKADPERVEHWRSRLAELGSGLKVGISWRSRLMTSSRARHYVPLREWSPILATPGVHFVNLQYSDYAEDIAQANAGGKPAIHHFHDLNLRDALDEVAALISALDLVITICNVNMDLSGALGKETWLFAFRHAMTWATLGCDDTPWFPGVRLFGRSWDQTWEGAVANVAAALRERVPPAS